MTALLCSRGITRHDYIEPGHLSGEIKRENSHFSRNPTRTSFEEMLHFLDVVEAYPEHEPDDVVHHFNWSVGDFKVELYRDFGIVAFTVVGLRFDPVALEQAFSGESTTKSAAQQPVIRRAGGRPSSPAWPIWIAELVHYIHQEGFPDGEGSQGQEAIISAVADRLASRGQDSPSRATVQPAVRAVLERLRAPES